MYWVPSGCSRLYWFLLGLTRFYWYFGVLLGFYRVLPSILMVRVLTKLRLSSYTSTVGVQRIDLWESICRGFTDADGAQLAEDDARLLFVPEEVGDVPIGAEVELGHRVGRRPPVQQPVPGVSLGLRGPSSDVVLRDFYWISSTKKNQTKQSRWASLRWRWKRRRIRWRCISLGEIRRTRGPSRSRVYCWRADAARCGKRRTFFLFLHLFCWGRVSSECVSHLDRTPLGSVLILFGFFSIQRDGPIGDVPEFDESGAGGGAEEVAARVDGGGRALRVGGRERRQDGSLQRAHLDRIAKKKQQQQQKNKREFRRYRSLLCFTRF